MYIYNAEHGVSEAILDGSFMKNKTFLRTLWVWMLFLFVGTTYADVVATQEALNAAVSSAEAGATVEISAAGTYKVPGVSKNITIKGTVNDVVFDCVGSGSIASIPNGCTFENVAFNMGTNDYHGFQHAGTINMNSCTINGKFFSYGDMNFIGCTFNQTASDYSMWAYAGNITYKNCTINCNGKFVNVYNEGNGTWKVNADGCTFYSTKSNKAALNIKESCCNGAELHFDITISNCTTTGLWPSASGDDNSTLYVGGPLWQVDDRTASTIENSKNGVGVKVTVDGVVAYGPTPAAPVAKIGETEYTTLADAFAEVAEGQSVVLLANTEVTEKIVVSKSMTLDLNGFVITDKVNQARVFEFASAGIDFTIEGTTEGSGMTIPEGWDDRNGTQKAWGFIRTNYAGCNITLNGGTYTGKTQNGSFITTRTNGFTEANVDSETWSNVTLNNVSMSTNLRALDIHYANKVIVNGGSFVATGGEDNAGNPVSVAFSFDAVMNASFEDVTCNSPVANIEAAQSEVKFVNCDFTAVCGWSGSVTATNIGVSYGGHAVVESGSYKITDPNTLGTAEGASLFVYSSGGTIEVNDGTFTGVKDVIKIGFDRGSYGEYFGEGVVPSKVIIKGGTFSGSYNKYYGSDDDNKVVISGGTFNVDPTDYVVNGYEAKKNEEGTWSVEKKHIHVDAPTITNVAEGDKNNETIVNDAVSNAPVVIDNTNASIEEKVAALETISTVVKSISENTAALEEITEEGGKTSVEAAVEEVKSVLLEGLKTDEDLNDAEKSVLDEAKTDEKADIHTYLVIELKEATVNTTAATGDASASAEVKKISFDVTPKASIIIANGQTVTATIPNSAIKEPIKFRLPVPTTISKSYLKVMHTHGSTTTDLGLHEVKTSESNKYIEVESENFSVFSYIIPIDERDGVGKIGTVCYDHNVPIATGVHNATIFSISHKTASAIILTEVEETMVAGQPYIYVSGNDEKVTFSPDEDGTPVAAGSNNGLYGVLVETTFSGEDLGTTDETRKYVIKDNKIATVTSGYTITVKANRAYIVLGAVSTTPTGSASARTLNLGIEGDNNGVTAIKDVNTNIDSVDEIYTIDGKESMDTQGKVLILRHANGKSSKVIIK